LCEKGRKVFQGKWAYGDVLPDVAKTALDHLHRHMASDEIRHALADVAAADPNVYQDALEKVVDGLAQVQSVPFRKELVDYLIFLPACIRQVLRRPSDANGLTAPDRVEFYKPEELLVFLPPRTPRFRPGQKPAGLGNWTLTELRGLGECSEVWLAEDRDHPDEPPAALKFATDPESKDRLKDGQDLFKAVFELNDVSGVVPLRSVYLETDPPCLESVFVTGYDLTALINDWRWRYDTAKPEASLKVMRRLVDVVAKAHQKGIVHRDLKPSNVLLHPTEGGKFTLWVTDFGWGQVESVRSLELARGGTPRGEQLRLTLRGAYSPLYVSPQQTKKEKPDPRDDVHALGVIWIQLLQRNPTAAAPVGTEWAEELAPVGFTDTQARLLTACLSVRPDKRPENAQALSEMLANVTVGPSVGNDGSKLISLKAGKGSHIAVPTVRPHVIEETAAASAAAAALLMTGDFDRPGESRSGHLPKMVRNGVGMLFTLVSPGTFKMGSPDGEPGRRDHESPQHDARITRPFYLSVDPVTQGQYERVTGKNASMFCRGKGGGPEHPVEMVTWADTEKFCVKLGQMPDEEIAGRHYRLPTEAEWEYVCRAGTTDTYSTGPTLSLKEGLFTPTGSKATGGKTAPVGQHGGNPWGLRDMHGNVWEWVQDWYDEYYYFDSPGNDPAGPRHGILKVARGGSWASPPTDCRSASRLAHAPDRPSHTIGFRLAMTVG
jgi:formylglycine-generating enzyme required for sulfatase activity